MTSISSGMGRMGPAMGGSPPPKPPRAADGQQPPSMAEMFDQIDTDGDGSISATELTSALSPGEGGAASGATTSAAGTSSDGSSTTSTSTTGSANSASGWGMDTQAFAGMMGGGMPPPPPPGAGGGDGSGSDDDAQQDLFNAIDDNGDGSLSKQEVQGFEEKMRKLFESMQQMGWGGGTGDASASNSSTGTDSSSAAQQTLSLLA